MTSMVHAVLVTTADPLSQFQTDGKNSGVRSAISPIRNGREGLADCALNLVGSQAMVEVLQDALHKTRAIGDKLLTSLSLCIAVVAVKVEPGISLPNFNQYPGCYFQILLSSSAFENWFLKHLTIFSSNLANFA